MSNEYPYIIEMCNITKEFPGIIANDNINVNNLFFILIHPPVCSMVTVRQ